MPSANQTTVDHNKDTHEEYIIICCFELAASGKYRWYIMLVWLEI